MVAFDVEAAPPAQNTRGAVTLKTALVGALAVLCFVAVTRDGASSASTTTTLPALQGAEVDLTTPVALFTEQTELPFKDGDAIEGCHGSGRREHMLNKDGVTGIDQWCGSIWDEERCEQSYIIVDKAMKFKHGTSGWAAPCVWRPSEFKHKSCDAVAEACPTPEVVAERKEKEGEVKASEKKVKERNANAEAEAKLLAENEQADKEVAKREAEAGVKEMGQKSEAAHKSNEEAAQKIFARAELESKEGDNKEVESKRSTAKAVEKFKKWSMSLANKIEAGAKKEKSDKTFKKEADDKVMFEKWGKKKLKKEAIENLNKNSEQVGKAVEKEQKAAETKATKAAEAQEQSEKVSDAAAEAAEKKLEAENEAAKEKQVKIKADMKEAADKLAVAATAKAEKDAKVVEKAIKTAEHLADQQQKKAERDTKEGAQKAEAARLASYASRAGNCLPTVIGQNDPSHHPTFANLEDAKKACEQDSTCDGVYTKTYSKHYKHYTILAGKTIFQKRKTDRAVCDKQGNSVYIFCGGSRASSARVRQWGCGPEGCDQAKRNCQHKYGGKLCYEAIGCNTAQAGTTYFKP